MGFVCIWNIAVLWLNAKMDPTGFWCRGLVVITEDSLYFVLDGGSGSAHRKGALLWLVLDLKDFWHMALLIYDES